MLLEEWNGCTRPLDKDEKICLLLEQWGSQARSVNLIMADASQYEPSTGQRKANSAGPRAHGKVAAKKLQSQHKDRLSKKALAREVEKLMKMVDAKQAELQSLTTPQPFLHPPPTAAGRESSTRGEQEPYQQVGLDKVYVLSLSNILQWNSSIKDTPEIRTSIYVLRTLYCVPNMLSLCKFTRHPSIQETLPGPQGVHNRGVPLYFPVLKTY